MLLSAQTHIFFGRYVAVCDPQVPWAAVEKIAVNVVDLKLLGQIANERAENENIHAKSLLPAADAKPNNRPAVSVGSGPQDHRRLQSLSDHHLHATDSPMIRHFVGGMAGDRPPRFLIPVCHDLRSLVGCVPPIGVKAMEQRNPATTKVVP